MSLKLESIGAVSAAAIGAVGAILESPIAVLIAVVLAAGVTTFRITDPERLKLRRSRTGPVAAAPKHDVAAYR